MRRLVVEAQNLPGDDEAVRFDGRAHGSSVSFFITRNSPGTGPKLHKHPYEEIFIIQEGRGRFTIGDEEVEAGEGQIIVVPVGTPHKFANIGEERLRMVNIHPKERMETEWLE